jgi:hypothetical protein
VPNLKQLFPGKPLVVQRPPGDPAHSDPAAEPDALTRAGAFVTEYPVIAAQIRFDRSLTAAKAIGLAGCPDDRLASDTTAPASMARQQVKVHRSLFVRGGWRALLFGDDVILHGSPH